MFLGATSPAVALPGELWLAAGALLWPVAAWTSTAVRGVTGAARSRTFARTGALAIVVAVILLAAAALLFATNGSTRAFQALAAQLAAGASLVGGLLSGGVALTLRLRRRSVAGWPARRRTIAGIRPGPVPRSARDRSARGGNDSHERTPHMEQGQDRFRTLEEAVAEPREHRDMDLAMQPMPNYSSTPDGPHGQPIGFWAAWELEDRPRRIALLVDDCQEEYRPYAEGILPNVERLVEAFRTVRDGRDGVAIAWSAWSRMFDDGISNAMDRWYGPRGLRPEEPENAAYVFTGAAGLEPLAEIAPTAQERADGWFYLGKHLDMFWTFDEQGESYLDGKLKALDIDTIVIVGLWTDECVLSTAYAGNSRGYDVVVVGDAVATATSHHEAALTVANGTVANVLSTDEVVSYLHDGLVTGEPGAVKGTEHPDGRKVG